MSNIWADTFSAIRDPHLSEEKKEKEEKGEKKHKEGPAEEKAEKNGEKENDKPKRWWDDDGDGKGYEKGEVSGKFPKKKVAKEERELHSKNGKNDKLDVRKGIHNKINTKPTVTEELEAWIDELLDEGYDLSEFTLEEIVGIYESVQLDEAQVANRNPDEYERKNSRGINNPNTGINSKAFLDFYAKQTSSAKKKAQAKVNKEEVEQLDELSNRTVGNALNARIAATGAASDREMKNRTPQNMRDSVRAAEKESSMRSAVAKRRVRMSKEEYMDEADTYGMPAKGDAERQKADPMAAAKAKAARAKVSKERADLQVAQQTQRLKVSATESVLAFVEGRTPLFEARFDPKKSKLRSAAERTKDAMTDAQRKAKEKEAKRTAEIHSKGETVLAGLRPQGKKGKVQTTPAAKPAAPAANRTVKGKEDKLASAADKVLKSLKNK